MGLLEQRRLGVGDGGRHLFPGDRLVENQRQVTLDAGELGQLGDLPRRRKQAQQRGEFELHRRDRGLHARRGAERVVDQAQLPERPVAEVDPARGVEARRCRLAGDGGLDPQPVERDGPAEAFDQLVQQTGEAAQRRLPDGLPLVGTVAGARVAEQGQLHGLAGLPAVDRPAGGGLEEPDGVIARVLIEFAALQQAGQDRRPEHRLVLLMVTLQQQRRRVGGQKRLGGRGADKAERHRLVVAVGHQCLGQQAAGGDRRLGRADRQRQRVADRDRVQAVEPGDLFDQVHFTRQVQAIRRDLRRDQGLGGLVTRARACRGNRYIQTQATEVRRLLLVGQVQAKQIAAALPPQLDPRRAGQRLGPGTPANDARRQGAPRQLNDHLRGASAREVDAPRIDPPLEAEARVAGELQRPPGGPHGQRFENRRLQQDVGRGFVDLRVPAAHDPRHRLGALPVGDDQHVPAQLVLAAVDRGEALALRCPPHHDPSAREPAQVKRVQRLTHLMQDEVRRVHDVVDRPQAHRLQPGHEVRGAGADLHPADHPGGVERAAGRVLQVHRDPVNIFDRV